MKWVGVGFFVVFVVTTWLWLAHKGEKRAQQIQMALRTASARSGAPVAPRVRPTPRRVRLPPRPRPLPRCVLPATPTRPCMAVLASLGVRYKRTRNPRGRPKGSRKRVCSVVNAVRLYSPIHGVSWVDGEYSKAPLLLRCELALAVARFSKYLRARQIVKVMHFGTYNCKRMRTDKGRLPKISQHGLGRAVDIAAFWDTKRTLYSVYKHWDHKTTWTNPKGQVGCWSKRFKRMQAGVLYGIACDMWKRKFFSVLLTPNFNKVHDDHFHADLSRPPMRRNIRCPQDQVWLDARWSSVTK